ncbi:MAG: VapE domain-containing protein [Tabrizicola flagellatus]|uniref:VapE domain-containing protein n=1 Tax=Tabrizicola flagellatus TaxID=2593021 RepID=UPI00391D3992
MQEYTETRPMAQAHFNISATDLSDLLGCTETHGDLLTADINRATADNSGCDLPLAVSLFADVKAQRIEPNHLSLRQLQDRLNSTTARDKAALPLVKLATFGDARTDKGSLRHDANLLRVSGVEGDYDAGAVSPRQAAERLRRAGIASLIYTTPSHTAQAPRWRVLAPLARQVEPAEREALCARLNGALGGILATESFTPSQSYYFGGLAERPPESFLVEGQPLDRVSGVASIGPQPKPGKSTTDLSDLFREPADRAEVRRALFLIDSGIDRKSWVDIGMALHSEFWGSREGFKLFHEWSAQSEKYKGEEDCWGRWRSFKPGKIGIGTLFEFAKAYGWERQSVGFCESDFDDLPALPTETKQAKIGIITAKNGEMKPTLHNAILVLRNVNRDQGYSIRKNDMTGQDEWRAGPINDADLGLIRVAIEQAGMHNVGADLTAGAVRAVAELNRYHPVKDWLESLRHDGKPRLDSWLTRYLGVDASPYSRAVGRAFLVAMVARVMRPGCKHDHVLVLGGAQGIGKSTACRILGGDWSGDNMPSIRDGAREAGLYLRGHWLVELAELAPSRKAEAEDLKAFLTRATDEIRAPYARRADIVPRQCVFVGTTNETAFLRDASGGRRFWPVTCGAKIETEALAADREQLFAEAVAAFRAGEAWHLPPDLERQAAIEQEAAREEHPWEQPIRRILDGLTEGDGFDRQPKDSVTVAEVLTLLRIPIEKQNGTNAKHVAGTLRMLGWKSKHTGRGNRWVRP